MPYELAYGKGVLSFDLPPGVTPQVIRPANIKGLPDPLNETRKALQNPTGTPPLLELLRMKKPKNLVLVVNDITRPTPYATLFPPLLEIFAAAGIKDEQITLLIAAGIHDAHTDEQNRQIYGEDIIKRFKIVCHDAGDDASLAYVGRFASGYDFTVNKLALEADFLLSLGVIMPHYFAGYSGGRKSILPGLAGRKTVENNHARMVEIMDHLPPIDENPVSTEMIGAAKQIGLDFILNVVVNDVQEPIMITAGEVEKAWRAGVDVSASLFEVPFDEQADICVTCASGHPRDINAYQAQKALDHADHLTRPGGTIILAMACPAGYGEHVFEEWMRRKWPPRKVMDEIKKHFVLGGHKAYGYAKVAAEKEVSMITDMDEELVALLYARKFSTVQQAVDAACSKYGPGAKWAYMPEGSLSLPVRRSVKI
ncbi:MAG: nickel-dependent lactate racemase [Deltaproteobacteria bacterium]|jgi:nickel-dependent lactate racemase|nr:nickel-dependent lactate racemase [Deltaproteobacteria bacterium]